MPIFHQCFCEPWCKHRHSDRQTNTDTELMKTISATWQTGNKEYKRSHQCLWLSVCLTLRVWVYDVITVYFVWNVNITHSVTITYELKQHRPKWNLFPGLHTFSTFVLLSIIKYYNIMMKHMQYKNPTYQSVSEYPLYHADLCVYKMNKDNLYLLWLIDN